MSDHVSYFKAPARIRDPHAGQRKVRQHPRCRLCNKGPHGLNAHHLVPRGMGGSGGDDVEDNFVALCGSGTTGCHGHVEHWVPGIRERLRELLTADEVAYVVGKRGGGWLDRNYPRPSGMLAPREKKGAERSSLRSTPKSPHPTKDGDQRA